VKTSEKRSIAEERQWWCTSPPGKIMANVDVEELLGNDWASMSVLACRLPFFRTIACYIFADL